jgi:hypothetical protein
MIFGKGGPPPGCHGKGLEAMTFRQSTSIPVDGFHFGGRPISIKRAAEGWKPWRGTLGLALRRTRTNTHSDAGQPASTLTVPVWGRLTLRQAV